MGEVLHVKYRLLSWHQEVDDALGNKVVAERTAMHGQRITADAAPEEDADPTVIYGVPQKEIDRLKSLPDYPFFTEDEEAAYAAGVTDYTGAQYSEDRISGDTGTSLSEASLGPDAIGGQLGGGHPLAFEEMNVEQLSEWMKAEEPDTNKLIELAYSNPLMTPNIMDAANLAERDDVDALATGLAAVQGAGGTAENPPDPGTENNSGTQGHGTAGDGGEGEEPTSEAPEAPSANASTAEWASFFEAQGLSTTDDSGADKKRDAMVQEWDAKQKESA